MSAETEAVYSRLAARLLAHRSSGRCGHLPTFAERRDNRQRCRCPAPSPAPLPLCSQHQRFESSDVSQLALAATQSAACRGGAALTCSQTKEAAFPESTVFRSAAQVNMQTIRDSHCSSLHEPGVGSRRKHSHGATRREVHAAWGGRRALYSGHCRHTSLQALRR